MKLSMWMEATILLEWASNLEAFLPALILQASIPECATIGSITSGIAPGQQIYWLPCSRAGAGKPATRNLRTMALFQQRHETRHRQNSAGEPDRVHVLFDFSTKAPGGSVEPAIASREGGRQSAAPPATPDHAASENQSSSSASIRTPKKKL